MFKYILTAVIAFLFAFTVMQAKAWDHAVIMKPHEGATYTVPLVPGFPNCVYVTDCKTSIYNPDPPGTPADLPATTPPPEPPATISEIPNIRGIPGWEFGVPIERTGWTVEVDNTEDSNTTKAELYKKEHAVDDDVKTIWHTRWMAPAVPMPHWIIVDMQTEHWVDGMVIHPRPWAADCSYCDTSNVKGYEVWVSKDNNIWGRVANGELTFTEGAPQTIDFLIPNLVRYVRLTILSASGDTPAVTLGDIGITESLKDIVIEGGAVQ